MRVMGPAMCDTIVKLLVGACLAVAPAGGVMAQQRAEARTPECKLEAAGAGTVRAVLDGRTLVLGDGREVRLAGIELPGADQRNAAALAGKTALAAMLAGREVALKRLGADADRHGRVRAYVFAAGEQRPAQQAMVALGHARVAARIGDAGCASALLAAERAARTARLGLWADPAYAMRQADDPAGVLAERGRFTLIEGKVVSVRESGGTIYVNFGRRWSEDFTATVLKRGERAFTAAGLDLKKLAGRTVRVRGFVEERGGPWIELTHPEQIELAERD